MIWHCSITWFVTYCRRIHPSWNFCWGLYYTTAPLLLATNISARSMNLPQTSTLKYNQKHCMYRKIPLYGWSANNNILFLGRKSTKRMQYICLIRRVLYVHLTIPEKLFEFVGLIIQTSKTELHVLTIKDFLKITLYETSNTSHTELK